MIVRGMVAGNLLAFLLGGLQYVFHFIKLEPATYYMDTVPVYFNVSLYCVAECRCIVDFSVDVDCPDNADFADQAN